MVLSGIYCKSTLIRLHPWMYQRPKADQYSRKQPPNGALVQQNTAWKGKLRTVSSEKFFFRLFLQQGSWVLQRGKLRRRTRASLFTDKTAPEVPDLHKQFVLLFVQAIQLDHKYHPECSGEKYLQVIVLRKCSEKQSPRLWHQLQTSAYHDWMLVSHGMHKPAAFKKTFITRSSKIYFSKFAINSA